jgi:putative PIN family toxin of toxin-antitoxin system
LIRIVLDTDVILSAIIFGGKPRTILENVIRGNIGLYISEAILNELKRVLNRPKFHYSTEIIRLITSEFTSIAELVDPATRISVIRSDPEDNRILECAVEANVEYIITGDSHLLELRKYENIRILTPAQLCNKLDM